MERRRATLALLAVSLLAVSGVAAHGGVHGTHATPRTQVVGDGSVVVDAVALNREGYVVIRKDDDGRPGDPIGSTALKPGIHEDVSVRLDEPLPEGTTPLWAAVHTDDGDGTFEPGEDPAVQSVVGIAASPFEVRTGGRSAFVLGATEAAQPANDSVLVNRVALPEDGHVVVHADDRGRLGEVVGNASVSAGTHYNVVVEVNRSALPEDRAFFKLWAVAYTDDGDGTFEEGTDEKVTVGGEPVASRISLRKANGSIERTTVATPSPTPEGSSSATRETAATGASGPGFGVAVTAVALAGVAVLAGRQRRNGR